MFSTRLGDLILDSGVLFLGERFGFRCIQGYEVTDPGVWGLEFRFWGIGFRAEALG